MEPEKGTHVDYSPLNNFKGSIWGFMLVWMRVGVQGPRWLV